MTDPGDMVLSCTDRQRIVGAMNRIMPLLPPEIRRRLNAIKMSYLAAYGVEGLYDRVNGRSVAQVLAEYQEPAGLSMIAEGERDGVRFKLYDSPRSTKDPE
jgi:hypothetical protein